MVVGSSPERNNIYVKDIAGLTQEEERAATVFRALGNPARVRMVTELARRNACVPGDFFSLLPLAQSTVSEHLRVLRESGIVKADGSDGCFCLDEEVVRWLAQFCTDICCPPDTSADCC